MVLEHICEATEWCSEAKYMINVNQKWFTLNAC